MNDFNKSFFNMQTANTPVYGGDLLVAQPFLNEVWFKRGVISIIDHDHNGSFGIVMNLSTNYLLANVLDGIQSDRDIVVYCGGPLSQDRLYFIHTLGKEIIPGARQFAPGRYIGGDLNAAINYINGGYQIDGYIRFFVGYSGWSNGQLNEEIEADTWAVLSNGSADEQLLHGNGDNYWQRMVRQLGEQYRSWRIIPRDVNTN